MRPVIIRPVRAHAHARGYFNEVTSAVSLSKVDKNR